MRKAREVDLAIARIYVQSSTQARQKQHRRPALSFCTVMDTHDVAREEVLIRLVNASAPTATTPREIEQEYARDPEIASVKNALATGDWSSVDKAYNASVK